MNDVICKFCFLKSGLSTYLHNVDNGQNVQKDSGVTYETLL